MHIVIYLPAGFYSVIAAAISETLQAANELSGEKTFSWEFVSPVLPAVSRSSISFPARRRPRKTMDVLVVLTGLGSGISPTLHHLDSEAEKAKPYLDLAVQQKAIIATTCAGAYTLAANGLLNRKKATISWWLKTEAQKKFPKVKWDASRIVIRDKNIYTTGGGFSGLELISTLLTDTGFGELERKLSKALVLPPQRQLQTPYEMELQLTGNDFEATVQRIWDTEKEELTVERLGQRLHLTYRTLCRKFIDQLGMSPGKWLQDKRMEEARLLLEESSLSVSEICYQVGYSNTSSFSRLFLRTTGLSPGEYRKQMQPVRHFK